VAPLWWLRAAQSLCARRSVVLCYHGVGATTSSEDPHFLHIAPNRFRSQLVLLQDAGFEFVTVAELARRAAGEAPPPGLAAVSFDDGMEDNYSVALPILRELGVPATVYVTTGLIGKPNPWVARSETRMLNADELRALAAAGIELGAHTVTHPDLSQLDHATCLSEMVESRATIERITGAKVETFAYPFCKYGEAALAAARDAGFRAAVTCQGQGSWAPLEMKRALITGKDGLPSFLLKLAGGYEPIAQSRPGRAFRIVTRAARARARARMSRNRHA